MWLKCSSFDANSSMAFAKLLAAPDEGFWLESVSASSKVSQSRQVELSRLSHRFWLTFLDLVNGFVEIRSAFETFAKGEAFLQTVVQQVQYGVEQNLVAPNVHDVLVLVMDIWFDYLHCFPSLFQAHCVTKDSYERARRGWWRLLTVGQWAIWQTSCSLRFIATS